MTYEEALKIRETPEWKEAMRILISGGPGEDVVLGPQAREVMRVLIRGPEKETENAEDVQEDIFRTWTESQEEK